MNRNFLIQSKRRKIISSLEKVRLTLNYTVSKWASFLNMTENAYLKVLQQEEELKLPTLYRLSENLNLNIDSFSKENIDLKALQMKYHGCETYIPEKYAKAAFSKMLSVESYLDYFESHYGWEVRQSILREFQLSEQTVSESDLDVNLSLFADLLTYLKKIGFEGHEIIGAGLNFHKVSKNSEFSKILSQARTPKETFEIIFGSNVSFLVDRNYQYKIRNLNNEECTFEAVPTEEYFDATNGNPTNNHNICLFKIGNFSSFTSYAGMGFKAVKKIRDGDAKSDYCRYRVNLRDSLSSVKEAFPLLAYSNC